jgi:predicted nucleotide-binding protein
MQLGDSGTAFLRDGSMLPPGPYPVYARVDVSDNGAVRGEVHFSGEPKHPRPIPLNQEFHLHVENPDSVFRDSIVLIVRFIDESGTVVGYRHGSLAQFRPDTIPAAQKDEKATLKPRNVFVISGRDKRLRDGMFTFLRSLDLIPMEWSHLVEKGSPYIGQVLNTAFTNAQAVVVLLTPDDLAQLRPELRGTEEPDHEIKLTPQARPNVLFEAGMAMATNEDRTILVEIGKLRPFSDIAGRHTIRMDNSSQKRNDLASRLIKAGCPVNLSGSDWHTAGDLTPATVQIPNGLPSRTQDANTQGTISVQIEEHLLQDLISELEDNLERARAPRVGDVYTRPSNSVWKEHRNKLNIPPDTRNQIANAYRQIDQWLDVVLTGLSPIWGVWRWN